MHAPAVSATAPIGVFDSGIGGLSVLRALMAELPRERFVYWADNAHAPYGERDVGHVMQRALHVGQRLRDMQGAKALVIACNTATAAAVEALRDAHADWPIVGVEPPLKPAALHTRSGRVGVLATRGTLASARYAALRDALARAHGTRFVDQACDGLAAAIEAAAAAGNAAPAEALLARHLAALGPLGPAAAQIDTVVLGCTHYPLLLQALRQLAGPQVMLIDPGVPVARQTRRLLDGAGLLNRGDAPSARLRLLASGEAQGLQAAAARWLGIEITVQAVD